jgi:glycosyltransferase involved in cell wall biosynthesis
MRILFLSRWYPYPPDNGSKLRVSGLLRGLCERHDVTLISFCDPGEAPAAAAIPAPVETHVRPFHEFAPRSRRAILGYSSPTPRFLVDTHSPEMERLIGDTVRRTRFDLVIASQLSMAAYHESFRGIPAIFEEAELGTYWPSGADDQSAWMGLRRRLTWAKHRRYMSWLLPKFMCCTVASDVERRLLGAAAPDYAAVHIVPNSIDAQPVTGAACRAADSLIFAGSLRYAPNRDGMTWFVNEVLPAVRAKSPGVKLTITGEAGPETFRSNLDVVLTGRVPDVRSLVAAAAISIAPLRLGGGTRLKVLEAMAVGTPVVATTKAVEGLDVKHEEHVLIADTPREFADAVHRLLRERQEAQAMAARALALCQARYDTTVVARQFLRVVECAAAA